jgi:HD-GYP domain-containing protein (c-di-GMP phosphodiesterase class II)
MSIGTAHANLRASSTAQQDSPVAGQVSLIVAPHSPSAGWGRTATDRHAGRFDRVSVQRWFRLLAYRRPGKVTLAQVTAFLLAVMEAKDPYTRAHGERVSTLAAMVAHELGLSRKRIIEIRFSAMFHDIGKLNIPIGILRKTGDLTEEEFASIQLHTLRGPQIVREAAEFFDAPLQRNARQTIEEAISGVQHHHERYDGTGYPVGLAGTEIPEHARVIAVADCFDAMTSTRSGRIVRTTEEAMAEIRRATGHHFDPQMVEALVTVLNRNEWPPPEPAPQAPPPNTEITWQSHDDPTHPLRIVGRPR